MQPNAARQYQPYKISIIKTLALLLFILAVQAVGSIGLGLILPPEQVVWQVAGNTLVQLGSYFLAIYIFYWRTPAKLDLALPKKFSISYSILLAASLALFALLVLMPFVEQLPQSTEVAEAFEEMAQIPMLALSLIVIIAPITEEIIFRNIILKGLSNRYNALLGLFVSSLLFGAFHLNFQQLIPAFILGLICGLLYLKTQSVLYTMLFHGLYNTFVLVLGARLVDENGVLETVSPLYGWLALPVAAFVLWQLLRGIVGHSPAPQVANSEPETYILGDDVDDDIFN